MIHSGISELVLFNSMLQDLVSGSRSSNIFFWRGTPYFKDFDLLSWHLKGMFFNILKNHMSSNCMLFFSHKVMQNQTMKWPNNWLYCPTMYHYLMSEKNFSAFVSKFTLRNLPKPLISHMQSFTPTGRTVTRTFVPPKMAIVWVERGTAQFFFLFFF